MQKRLKKHAKLVSQILLISYQHKTIIHRILSITEQYQNDKRENWGTFKNTKTGEKCEFVDFYMYAYFTSLLVYKLLGKTLIYSACKILTIIEIPEK